MIDKGKILLQETVEELLEKGYSISGVAQEVDHYLSDPRKCDVSRLKTVVRHPIRKAE